jgi:hypothetical protein
MVTNIKKIKPMFNGLVTTMDKYSNNQYVAGTKILDASKAGAVKEYQKVVAVGPMVRGIEVGDIVFINPKRYMVRKHEEGSLQDGVIKDNPVIGYNFDIVEINGTPHLYLQDNDIKYVAEIEEFEENPVIITDPKPKLELLN